MYKLIIIFHGLYEKFVFVLSKQGTARFKRGLERTQGVISV